MKPRVERPKGIRGLHYRLYDWVIHWSGHRHAKPALFLIALAEASFFPIPPDVLLISMSMARAKKALRYAAIATAGSVVGGLIGYAIGWGAWQALEGFAFEHLGLLGFNTENFTKVQGMYQSNAFLYLFIAGFTPIPYKVFTIAAGVFDVALPIFILASIFGRAGRFFLVAGLIGFIGPRVEPFIEKYLGWLTLAFGALLVLGFLLIGSIKH